MPPRPETPGDLLFGLLALQTGLIGQPALVAAFRDWTRTPGRSMAAILVGRGDLDADQRAALDGLAAQHLRKHGDDPERSLAALATGPSTRRELAQLASPDLDASLDSLATAVPTDDNPYLTVSHSIGTATSDGQRFRVLRPHAQGGLGAVFVALDGELNREVALKQILDRHADEPGNRSRFLVEAEITGGLEHPGIVPVYGLGHDPTGRPYYAMRFIRGDSLKEAIAAFHEDGSLKADPGRRSLALRKLLRRFVDVCNAIEYAHSRGVLHRDIKPGNIIVGKHGETLVVDWGLAKPMGQAEPGAASGEGDLRLSSLSGGTSETLPGSAVGTPAYMSPEQAAGDLDRLGPRSDVYSLGATLYSLLTGRPPFGGRDLAAVLKAVRGGDFAHPRAIDPGLDPALEAACLKAMATDPEARYDSPRGLADDLERWSADEPVSAYPEPFARRFRRWARRHKTTVTAASATTLAALIGLASVLAVQSRANYNLNLKNGELVEAGRQIQARFDLAQESIRTFRATVTRDEVLKDERFRELRDKLLRSAAEFYGKLGSLLEGRTDRRSRLALAGAYRDLGKLMDEIGVKSEASTVFAKELATRRELARGGDPGDLLEVADCLVHVGRSANAIGAGADALRAWDEVGRIVSAGPWPPVLADRADATLARGRYWAGYLLEDVGETSRALAAHHEGLAIRERLARAHPDDTANLSDLAMSHNDIGLLLDRGGEPARALLSYREGLAVRERLARAQPDVPEFQDLLASSLHNVGMLIGSTGDRAGELELQRRALIIRERLARAHGAVSSYQLDLANSHDAVGALYSETGEVAPALASHREALAIRERLARFNPAVTQFQCQLANSHDAIGWNLIAIDGPRGALASHREALAIREQLARAHPEVTEFSADLAHSLNAVGILQIDLGELDQASRSYREALAIRERLARAQPDITAYQSAWATSHSNLGHLFGRMRDPDRELESHRQALAIRERLARTNPTIVAFQSELATSYDFIGNLIGRSHGLEARLDLFGKALAIHERLARASPTVVEFQTDLASCYRVMGNLIGSEGEMGGAVDRQRQAVAVWERLTRDHPGVEDYQSKMADSLNDVASWLGRLGDPARELETLRDELAIRRKLAEAGPDRLDRQREFWSSLRQVGKAAAGFRQPAESVACFRQAIASEERIRCEPPRLYALACYQSMLAGAASQPDSGYSIDEVRGEEDRAVRMLVRAVSAGFLKPRLLLRDEELDAIRHRADFQTLVSDWAFPANPFAG